MKYVPQSPRERILASAIDILEREGPDGATTRAIAAAAGVNIAAINYYYRTKDGLLSEALASSWKHALEDIGESLRSEPWNPETGLLEIARYLLEGSRLFPRVTRTFLAGDGANALVRSSLAGLVAELAARVASRTGHEPDEALVCRTSGLISSFLYLALAADSLPGLSTPSAQERYIELLVADYCALVGDRPLKGGG